MPPFGVGDTVLGDPQTLAEQLALDVAARLKTAISVRDHAGLIVSGGSTPAAFLRCLSAQAIEWSKVTVTLADERWVPTDHADSNERMVRQTLLCDAAASAQFIGLKNNAAQLQQGLADCEATLAGLRWPFDVAVLGMGTDGHTASLFPDAGDADCGDSPHHFCLAATGPQLNHDRVSLTPAALLRSESLFLHIVGESKRSTLKAAFESGDTNRWPVLHLAGNGREKLRVFWSPE